MALGESGTQKGAQWMIPELRESKAAGQGARATFTPKEKANLISQTGLYLCRQRPEFILSEADGLPHTWRVQYHRPCAA